MTYRRSSKCDSHACVEVDDDAAREFHKSSRSITSDCVEVAVGGCQCHTQVLVRDSKDPDGPVLGFAPLAWTTFLDGVKTGAFDRVAGG